MKVQFLKDVLSPDGGLGRIGQVAEMSAHDAKHYLDKGLAKEADKDATVSEPKEDDKPKKPKPGASRETKTDGPAESKAPAGVMTHATIAPK